MWLTHVGDFTAGTTNAAGTTVMRQTHWRLTLALMSTTSLTMSSGSTSSIPTAKGRLSLGALYWLHAAAHDEISNHSLKINLTSDASCLPLGI